MSTIPESVLTAIRSGWAYESTPDPLEVVSVSVITAADLAAQIRAGSTGCDDLLEAIAELAPDADVYDVEDGTSHAVYTADGAQIWALS